MSIEKKTHSAISDFDLLLSLPPLAFHRAGDVAAFSSVRSVFWPRSNQIIPIGRSNERSASESELARWPLVRSLPRSKRTFYRVIVTAAFIHRRQQQQSAVFIM